MHQNEHPHHHKHTLWLLAGLFLFFFVLNVMHLPTFLEKIGFASEKEARCQTKEAAYRNAELSAEARTEDLLSRMTMREKIGQLALVEKNGLTTLDDVRDYGLGGLLSGSGSRPAQNTPQAWLGMVTAYQTKAKETCLGIPLLYGIDAIHGHGGVQGATVFPHALGLSATRDLALITRVADATAKEMLATGIHWNFAPSLDVAKDMRWGRVYETFGSDTQIVSEAGAAYIQGIQTIQDGYLQALATPKHFVGNGDTVWGSPSNPDYKLDQGDVTLDEETLRREHIAPFKKAIDEGALVIMAGLNSWNGKKISGSSYLLTDILKDELGFTGFVVSDWYGVYAIHDDQYTALVQGINAGIDMIMLPFEYKQYVAYMERALGAGEISETRLNDAARRILQAKFKAGLFDRPDAKPSELSIIGNEAHRALAREVVQKSQVLLKNTDSLLPLSTSTTHLLVAGSAADNLGRQSGGWTIEWQGTDGNNIPGTTILEGIRQTVSKETTLEFDAHANFATSTPHADVGIAIVGETPYAEGVGDTAHPALSAEDLETIQKLRARSDKLIVIIISGRPLDISEEAQTWDAVVASWLHGSEGKGVADTLFGVVPFTGTLPIPWEL